MGAYRQIFGAWREQQARLIHTCVDLLLQAIPRPLARRIAERRLRIASRRAMIAEDESRIASAIARDMLANLYLSIALANAARIDPNDPHNRST